MTRAVVPLIENTETGIAPVISASILSADFAALGADCKRVDVMVRCLPALAPHYLHDHLCQ